VTVHDRAASVVGVVFDVDGVLTDGSLHFDREGESTKVFSARDGMGMAMLRDSGIKMAIVSGRPSPVVEERARSLGVHPVLLGRMDKAAALEEIANQWQVSCDELAAVGDDLVDIPMLRRAGLSAAPADADPRVREAVELELTASGGRGAARELCEFILSAQGKLEAFLKRFEVQDP
jgi:3-deoxy-D-manno-octulosonate 8-phosphate phosphatase (KDO 8-P phosphatase)